MGVPSSVETSEERVRELELSNQQLRSIQDHFRELLDNSRDIILRRNYKQGTVEYVSPSSIDVLGYTPEEVAAMPDDQLRDMIHPDDLPLFQKQLKAGLQSKNKKENVTVEYRIKRKDGIYIWLNEQLSVVKDKNDRVDFVVGNARDITKRKETENALRESEQKYRSVVDNIGIGVTLLSPSMEVLTMNAQMRKWYPSVDITTKPICYKIFNDPPQEQKCSYCPVSKTLSDGQVHESITETPTGETITNYRIVSSPILDKDGKLASVIELVEDITERRRAEQALQASEEFNSSLLNNSPNPIVVSNPDTSIRYVNPALEALTGFSAEEVIGKKVPYPWWPDETIEQTTSEFEKIFPEGTDGLEKLFQTKWGDRFWIKLTSTAIKAKGKARYYLSNWVDITARKRAEAALQKAHDELEMRVKERTADLVRTNRNLVTEISIRKQKETELRASEEQVRALNEQILNMLMLVSHDIRSPLVSIQATFKLILRGIYGSIDESLRNTVNDLYGRIGSLLGIVEECLGKTTVIAGEVDMERKILDLREDVIDPVLEELLPDIQEQRILIDNRLGAIPGRKIPIRSNKLWLKIVYRNLFSNAIKYGGNGCAISFGFEAHETHYKLNVFNTGNPIPEDRRNCLFVKFSRPEEKDGEIAKGMGLGLYLVRKVIQEHGGDVWYEPQPNGSNFAFTIPRE